jgi:hypothetical protein
MLFKQIVFQYQLPEKLNLIFLKPNLTFLEYHKEDLKDARLDAFQWQVKLARDWRRCLPRASPSFSSRRLRLWLPAIHASSLPPPLPTLTPPVNRPQL